MSAPVVGRRRRTFRILRLFFSFVVDYTIQYARARALGRSYDFFQDERHNRQRAIRLRRAALDMGGVLIKVGQFLSSRVDLLPSEYIEELALLQDEVPAVPAAQIRAVVEAEFRRTLEDIFQSFDPTPVAAASLGQVHHAVLLGGEQVAVKVQRPNIEEIIEADLAALRYIVGWLRRHTPISRRTNLELVLKEFEDTLRLELDYQREAHHAERLSVQLAGFDDIVIPRVYWSHVRTRVLTMQYVDGIKVTDFPAVEAAGISRSAVAELLLRAYLQQIVEDGFFHADPHPGNIFLRPGPIVVLVDFGMVGEIAASTRDELRRVFLAVVRRDAEQILVSLDRLGFINSAADTFVLRRAIAWALDTFAEMSFSELQSVDPHMVIDRFQDVIYTESVRIPANFAFLGRAVGTLSGLCTALDPSLQFMTVAEPYARRLLQQQSGLAGTVQTIVGEARSLASAAYSIPYLTRGALQRVQQGELDFHQELADLHRDLQRVESGMRRLLFGLLLAAFVVAGAFVFPTHEKIFSIGAFLVSLVLLVGVISPFRRPRR